MRNKNWPPRHQVEHWQINLRECCTTTGTFPLLKNEAQTNDYLDGRSCLCTDCWTLSHFRLSLQILESIRAFLNHVRTIPSLSLNPIARYRFVPACWYPANSIERMSPRKPVGIYEMYFFLKIVPSSLKEYARPHLVPSCKWVQFANAGRKKVEEKLTTPLHDFIYTQVLPPSQLSPSPETSPGSSGFWNDYTFFPVICSKLMSIVHEK